MNFWQAARREAAGALRSVRYDFVETLVGNRGTRRVLALTGLTALVAAGGVGTAFAVANTGPTGTTPAAHDRPAVVVSASSDATALDSPTTVPHPSTTPRPSARSNTQDTSEDDSTPSPSPSARKSTKPPAGHPTPKPGPTSPKPPPSPPTSPSSSPSPSPSQSSTSPTASTSMSTSPSSTFISPAGSIPSATTV